MSKEDIVAVVEDVVTVDEVIEMKEKLEAMSKLQGIRLEEPVGQQKIKVGLTTESLKRKYFVQEMAEEIIDIERPGPGRVKFEEVEGGLVPGLVLDSVTNTEFQSARLPARSKIEVLLYKYSNYKLYHVN